MSEIIFVAIIGVAGSVLVAIVTVITQLFVTRAVIKSEHLKISQQLHGEELSRLREKRRDRILDGISELLTTSDPQSTNGVDYGRTTNLVLQVQLLLDLTNTDEKELNSSLNRLAAKLQEYVVLRKHPVNDELPQTINLLQAQDLVIQQTRKILKRDLSPAA
ncbi:MAG: hypothetical protein ABR936_15180 [Bacteroidota bacterium]|jgi:hypothetical protein